MEATAVDLEAAHQSVQVEGALAVLEVAEVTLAAQATVAAADNPEAEEEVRQVLRRPILRDKLLTRRTKLRWFIPAEADA